jgi:hypothetical protein
MHTTNQAKAVHDPVLDLRNKLARMERDVKKFKDKDKDNSLPPQSWPMPPKVNAFHR